MFHGIRIRSVTSFAMFLTIYKKYSNDEVYNSDVTLKLLLLKGLMKAEEMPVVQTVRSEKLEPV